MVLRRRDDARAVRTEGGGPHRTFVPAHDHHLPAGGGVPDGGRRQGPPGGALHARGARLRGRGAALLGGDLRLRRRNLGKPRLLARERFLLFLSLGLLARPAGSEIGDARLAAALAEILAAGEPFRIREALGAMIEPSVMAAVAGPFAGGALDAFDQLEVVG